MHAVESIAWLLAVALATVPLARRLGLPSVIGYMIVPTADYRSIGT